VKYIVLKDGKIVLHINFLSNISHKYFYKNKDIRKKM
jgi:hypothetical protein